MFTKLLKRLFAIFVFLCVLGIAIYKIPAVNYRLGWRLDAAQAYARGVIYPADAPPMPVHQPTSTPNAASPSPILAITDFPTATLIPTEFPTITPEFTPTSQPSPTPIPERVSLASPDWEKQDWNNCGPASLSLYLKMYGWQGDQFDISDLLKPERADRNVNVEELVYYVRNHAGWLNAEFRVGGDIDLLKQLLAAGIPVMIEEGTELDESYWPKDDRWAGHYLLLTGYDDTSQTFTGHDTYYGPDRKIPYTVLDENWKAFNRVFIIVYTHESENTVQAILGEQWDVEINRKLALEIAQFEVDVNPEDSFAWFNLGSNLVYFEQYQEAAMAFDNARNLGLPQRMFRYQFSPFIAYFHSFRIDDLMALTDYGLQRTPNSEETLLWQGWGFYRQGNSTKALEFFNKALEANPYYQDAQYAINFVLEN
jgi:tetratricopeptide (TPR) repeat protein